MLTKTCVQFKYLCLCVFEPNSDTYYVTKTVEAKTMSLSKELVCAFVLVLISCCTADNMAIEYCKDMQPQKGLDLEQLMGLWYGVEVIHHRDDPRHRGIVVVDSCPVLHLSAAGPQELRLIWDERAGLVEYHFRIPDMNNPGFWMSSGPQNGSLLQRPYKQFAGTVQVMKAVSTHVVLTFCSPNSEHYSVVLSREKLLSKMELRSVNNMLQRRGLNQVGIKEACRDLAAHLQISWLMMSVFLILLHLNYS